MKKGHFTLPGEAGHEKLTLELAERWGADVIRDSDGTKLSAELLEAGYDIYSTICVIREHNEWIKNHLDSRQQSFLCTAPVIAESSEISIALMKDFFDQQFAVNESKEALAFMQVYDRTTGEELTSESWEYIPQKGEVKIQTQPYHRYSVNFLAWRIWEEISMYNHTTNNWDKEHLMQLDPYGKEGMEYLEKWLDDWCKEHPDTDVVRFTSLFYNFAWIWGSNEKNRHLFTDWASYDFTVSPQALTDFEQEYGYALCAEDFTNMGRYNSTHSVPTQKKLDWMDFMGRFVRKAGKKLIDIVKAYGKKAYVFYDDSWVGLEPYNGHFEEFGFDGIIKCVFSGYEARLCAGVPVETHEIRLHPYLFPVGLGGAPTFSEGGHPEKDTMQYWINVRRALLREKIDRIGLGGYLHYVPEYPLFADAIDEVVKQFHDIADLHQAGAPIQFKPKVGILTAWGSLRSWTLSGHFHETYQHVLIQVIESLAGMQFDVKFLSFADIENNLASDVDVIINAGEENSAWSGGSYWQNSKVIENLTKWVSEGGVFLGIKEPSAHRGDETLLRMAHVLGVDIDTGERCCHGKWKMELNEVPGLIPPAITLPTQEKLYLTDDSSEVLLADGENVLISSHPFGKGKGIYLTDFRTEPNFSRLLQNLILYAAENNFEEADGLTNNANVECAVYPQAEKIVLVNNIAERQSTEASFNGQKYAADLEAYEMKILGL